MAVALNLAELACDVHSASRRQPAAMPRPMAAGTGSGSTSLCSVSAQGPTIECRFTAPLPSGAKINSVCKFTLMRE